MSQEAAPCTTAAPAVSPHAPAQGIRKALFMRALFAQSPLAAWRSLQPGTRIGDFRAVDPAAGAGHCWLVHHLLTHRLPVRDVRPSALLAAIGSGDIATVTEVMRMTGLQWHDCDSLTAAIQAHSETIVEAILASAPRRGVFDSCHILPVCGPEYNHVHKIILEKCPPVYNTKNAYRRLAAKGNVEILEMLVPDKSYLGIGFIYAAAQSGHVPTFEFARKIDPSTPVQGSVSLTDLANNGHLAMIEYIASKGLITFNDGAVAAQAAIRNGHVDLLAFLLETGKCVASPQFLDSAARDGRLNCVEYLLNHGLEYRPTVMDQAALRGHLHVVEWLAQRQPQGCTEAAMNTSHSATLQYLVDKYPELAPFPTFSSARKQPAFQFALDTDSNAQSHAFFRHHGNDDYANDTGGDGANDVQDNIDDEYANEELLWRNSFAGQLDLSRDMLFDDFYEPRKPRRQSKREQMHGGFKKVPETASNQECKQS